VADNTDMGRIFLRTHLTDREKLAIYRLLADWKSYGPMLSENAIGIMHDIGRTEAVQRVVTEKIQPRVVRERRMPNLWWGWVRK
jgi:hypothetical protein